MLKLIVMMSHIHKWDLAMTDVALAFLNAAVDASKGLIFRSVRPLGERLFRQGQRHCDGVC